MKSFDWKKEVEEKYADEKEISAPCEVNQTPKNPDPVKHVVVFHIADTFSDAIKEVSSLSDVLHVEISAQQNGKFLYRATCLHR